MNQERPYWNMEMEPLYGTPEMAKIQLREAEESTHQAEGQGWILRPHDGAEQVGSRETERVR